MAPTFLSKVFGRKRDEKESSTSNSKRHSTTSLLEGRFEAVSPNVSPSATLFPNSPLREKEKEKDKDGGFSALFRPRSRAVSPLPEAQPKSTTSVPHLTLNLPVPKEEKTRALGVVFEADPDDRTTLPDSVIGERRLNALEALLLIKACATAIVDRGGLETLGVMHPHWYSASPDVQRKLISLFILSLASKSPITTFTPSPTSPSLIFNSELEYTRSPHDIAAVLRWGLRHLRIEGSSFGSSTSIAGNDEVWHWYTTFAEAERASSFPVNAFSQSLIPQLPPAHLQLLTATLDIISSLAAHAETNGISGSKLSKFLGLWLLTSQRSQESDDWPAFYSRWERAGRILEHIFLSYIRDEASSKKMPIRLSELVKSYPYSKEAAEDGLLPRPRFSTRRYDALFVRVEAQLPDMKTPKPKHHPLRLITEALKAELGSSEYSAVWEQIRKAATSSSEENKELGEFLNGYPMLSQIFSDDTLRLLSLIPAQNAEKASSPTVGIATPIIRNPRPVRRRSASLGHQNGNSNGNGKAPHGKSATDGSTTTSPISPTSPTDWADFSNAGFGESAIGKNFASTLLDNDVEITTPPIVPISRKSSKRKNTSDGPVSRRSSADNPQLVSNRQASGTVVSTASKLKTKTSLITLTQLDEAFIDFWSDALLDPISSSWPSFVICQLKPTLGISAKGGSKPINWIVIEQSFTYPPPPPLPTAEPATPTSPTKRASSPRPSIKSGMSGRKSSSFRFSFFSGSESKSPGGQSSRKKAAKSPRIGEMGEILSEEEEEPKSPATPKSKGLGITGVKVAAGASAVAAAGTAAAATVTAKSAASDSPATKLSPVPVVDASPAGADAAAPEVAPVSTEPVKVEETQDKPAIPSAPVALAEATAVQEDEKEAIPAEPVEEASTKPAEEVPSIPTDVNPTQSEVLESTKETSASVPEPVTVGEPVPVVDGLVQHDTPEPAHAEPIIIEAHSQELAQSKAPAESAPEVPEVSVDTTVTESVPAAEPTENKAPTESSALPSNASQTIEVTSTTPPYEGNNTDIPVAQDAAAEGSSAQQEAEVFPAVEGSAAAPTKETSIITAEVVSEDSHPTVDLGTKTSDSIVPIPEEISTSTPQSAVDAEITVPESVSEQAPLPTQVETVVVSVNPVTVEPAVEESRPSDKSELTEQQTETSEATASPTVDTSKEEDVVPAAAGDLVPAQDTQQVENTAGDSVEPAVAPDSSAEKELVPATAEIHQNGSLAQSDSHKEGDENVSTGEQPHDDKIQQSASEPQAESHSTEEPAKADATS